MPLDVVSYLLARRAVKPPVLRSQLEYPTQNVTFDYLAAIDKVVTWGGTVISWSGVRTVDNFTDKAIRGYLYDVSAFFARQGSDNSNAYMHGYNSGFTTADFRIERIVNGTLTFIGIESVDLPANRSYDDVFSVVGSTLKASRNGGTTWNLSITDTNLTQGGFGVGAAWEGVVRTFPYGYRLLPPLSQLPQPTAVIEYPIAGSGKPDDPIRPDMPRELVEVDPATLPIDEAEAVKANPKSANGLPLVDRLSVTWGAIDYKGEATMITAIYSGSPSYLRQDRIQRHLDYAKSKNLLSETVKPDPQYVRDLHKRLTKDRKDMMITENELAYQLLGYEELEVDAVADFYERELVNLNRIKGVPEWELDRTIEMWIERARRHNRGNAIIKLNKVRRK